MAPENKSVWDHAADKDLLLTIIDKKGKADAFKWEEIEAVMVQKNYSFTKEACRQHFQKIRKESRAATSSTNSGSNTTAMPTPTKRARKPKASGSTSRTTSFTNSNGNGNSNGTSSFTSNGTGTHYVEDEDDDEEMATPSKRKKIIKKEGGANGNWYAEQTAVVFKHEDLSRGGLVDLDDDELYDEC